MKITHLGERSIKLIVISFSLVGLLSLSIISMASEVPKINLPEADGHIDQRVEIKAQVLGAQRSGSGSTTMMIIDGNDTLKVFIERSDVDYRPGWEVRITGEIVRMDDTVALTVQTDRSVSILKKYNVIEDISSASPGDPVSIECCVKSSSYNSWNSRTVIASPINMTEGGVGKTVRILALGFSGNILPGDILEVSSIKGEGSDLLSYGEDALKLINRPEPRTLSLIRFLIDVSTSPEGAPQGPFTLDGYLRYEPMGRTLYISDIAEGSTVSIKVRMKEEQEGLHRGDLVTLTNCSMVWDKDGLRFHLEPQHCILVSSHGPWILNLDSLERGLFDHLDCMVSITGMMWEINGTLFLQDGGSQVEVRDPDEVILNMEMELTGTVRRDTLKNCVYLDLGEADR